MRIKLRNPQEETAKSTIVISFYFSCSVSVLLLMLAILSGSWTLRAMLLLPIVLLIFAAIYTFWRWRKLLQLRKRKYHVTAVDFQEVGVLLEAPCQRFLPYAETDFRLRIYTGTVRTGRTISPGITKISLIFRPEGEEIEWSHITSFEGIFPILDQGVLFKNFSYGIDEGILLPRMKDYPAFVEEQIQNHLRYKIHFPFPKDDLVGAWIGAISLTLVAIFLKYESGTLAGLSFFILAIVIGWVPIWRFYRAKHQLDKYRK